MERHCQSFPKLVPTFCLLSVFLGIFLETSGNPVPSSFFKDAQNEPEFQIQGPRQEPSRRAFRVPPAFMIASAKHRQQIVKPPEASTVIDKSKEFCNKVYGYHEYLYKACLHQIRKNAAAKQNSTQQVTRQPVRAVFPRLDVTHGKLISWIL